MKRRDYWLEDVNENNSEANLLSQTQTSQLKTSSNLHQKSDATSNSNISTSTGVSKKIRPKVTSWRPSLAAAADKRRFSPRLSLDVKKKESSRGGMRHPRHQRVTSEKLSLGWRERH